MFMINFAEVNVAPTSFLESVTGQPFLVSLLLIFALLFAIYTVLEKLRIKGLQRMLALIPVMLLLAVAYFQHGPLMATLLLSSGFLLSFILAFAQLSGGK